MDFFRRHKIVSALVIVGIFVVVAFLMFSGNEDVEIETEVAERTTIRQVVEETGTIESSREAELSLEQTGQVSLVLVEKGDIVSSGDILILLDQSEQRANLLSAQAQLGVEKATLADMVANAGNNIETDSDLSIIKKQQQTLIENAYITLLSEGLITEPDNDNYTQTPPVISGRYVGPEGEYKVRLDLGSKFTDYEISVFRLETVRDVEIISTAPTPLGTRGLFISFPDPVANYMDTTWTVTIPNKGSSFYLSNYNSYIAAQEGGDTTVAQTEINIEKIQSQEARVEQARAAIATAEAQLSKRTLYAPFPGVIADVHVTEGEVIAPATPIVSLISDSDYKVVVDISEADIKNLSIGDAATAVFDAYEDETFTAHVVFITPSVKKIEGVSTLEVTLELGEEDERIRSGMTVDLDIVTAEREDAIVLSQRAVIFKGGLKIVRILKESGAIEEVEVITGISGERGRIEIISGIEEGDVVIISIKK